MQTTFTRVVYTTKPTLNSNGQDWSCAVDTSGFTTANANTPVYFAVGGKDLSGTGNTGYSTPLPVTVDRKEPSITTIKVNETDCSDLGSTTTKWFNSTTVKLNGTFADDSSGPDSLAYELKKAGAASSEGIKNVPSTGQFDVNIDGLLPGTNTISVLFYDKAGNKTNLGPALRELHSSGGKTNKIIKAKLGM